MRFSFLRLGPVRAQHRVCVFDLRVFLGFPVAHHKTPGASFQLTFLGIRPGRSFVRRLVVLSASVRLLDRPLRLNRSARNDILWWLLVAADCNRCSWFDSLGLLLRRWSCGPTRRGPGDAASLRVGALVAVVLFEWSPTTPLSCALSRRDHAAIPQLCT